MDMPIADIGIGTAAGAGPIADRTADFSIAGMSGHTGSAMGFAAGAGSFVIAVFRRMRIADTVGAGIFMVADILAITRIGIFLFRRPGAAGDALQQLFVQGVAAIRNAAFVLVHFPIPFFLRII